MKLRILAAVGVLLSLVSCGYHVGGKAETIPKEIRTIAIQKFANSSSRYRLTAMLPEGIARAMVSQSRFQLVNDPHLADAVLSGSINNAYAVPTIFDPVTGRASVVQISVVVQVQLTDRHSGKSLYSRPPTEYRNNYEISSSSAQYFDESNAAMQRLSIDLGRNIVDGIMEDF